MNKYTILDDFNTDFLDNPSKYLLDILNIFQLHQLKLESIKLSILTSLPKRYLILNVLVTKIGGN